MCFNVNSHSSSSISKLDVDIFLLNAMGLGREKGVLIRDVVHKFTFSMVGYLVVRTNNLIVLGADIHKG